MTIYEMQQRKKELGYTNEMIAEQSGVPLGTVQKIFAGFTKAPRRATILALEKVLGSSEAGQTGKKVYYRQSEPVQELKETAAVYAVDPKQGSYTLDDYYELPDDRRVELIDGCIYDMAAPTQVHQLIVQSVFLQLHACVENHPECEIFFAPLDVRLDNDNKTMVQPDILILCGYDDPDIRRINGAPDFITEVLSPSRRFHDMFRKLNKYRLAGVREYWIVDPEKLKVTVYDFEHDEPPVTYSFRDTVPVTISDGECSVDFSKVYSRIERYY